MIKRNYQKTQGLLEYAVFIAVCAAALIIMFAFMRNTLSGKWREAADVFGKGEQYSPYKTIETTEEETP